MLLIISLFIQSSVYHFKVHPSVAFILLFHRIYVLLLVNNAFSILIYGRTAVEWSNALKQYSAYVCREKFALGLEIRLGITE